MFCCDPCGKTFSGCVPYQQHVESVKHKKKVASLSYSSKNSEPTKTNEVTDTSHEVELIKCPACNLSFTSINQFQIHSLSTTHVNNVTKMLATDEVDNYEVQTVSSSAGNTDANSFQESQLTPKDDFLIPSFPVCDSACCSLFRECKICNKHFSGPEPYRQHLVSAAHKKKVEMANFTSSATQNPIKFECEPCKKVFSGHIPLQQHLVSDVHRKKLQQLQILDELNQQSLQPTAMEIDTNVSKTFFCKICMIQCSGLVPFNQHIAGETHAKNVKRQEILTNMNSNPEDQSGNQHTVVSPMLNVGIRNDETDNILDAFQNLAVLQPKEFDIKEFYPDDEINFDGDSEKKKGLIKENTTVETVNNSNMDYKDSDAINDISSVNENHINIVNYQSNLNGINNKGNTEEVYAKCELCNIKLETKMDTLLHYESIEHFRKKHSYSMY